MEHELPYAELVLVCPDGNRHQPRLAARTTRAAAQASQRLTAPNPGATTGPGTNSYLQVMCTAATS